MNAPTTAQHLIPHVQQRPVPDALVAQLKAHFGERCSTAMAVPIGRQHLGGPAQLARGATDGAISAAGPAMEQPMHELAAGAGQKDSGDLRGQPEQIAATTGHDHQLAATREKE